MLTWLMLVVCVGVCRGEWPTWGRDNQHGSRSLVRGQPMERVRLNVTVTNCTQVSQHQGVPLVTAANTVIFAVTDVVDNFSFCRNSVLVLRALDPAGNLMWTANTDWIIPPNHVVTANWVPHYQPVLGGAPGPSQRIYYPGPGGTIRWRDNLDQPNPISSGVIYLDSEQDYQVSRLGYHDTHFVNSGLAVQGEGLFYSVRVRPNAAFPLLTQDSMDFIVRVNTTDFTNRKRLASYVGGEAFFNNFPTQFIPAFTKDGSRLYWSVTTSGSFGPARMALLEASDLQLVRSTPILDPRSNSQYAWLLQDSTSSPTVGPDGDVYYGVLGARVNGVSRSIGWMMHWDSQLLAAKTVGGFGWDDTASLVDVASVPLYTGSSSYLLFIKFNDYLGREGGKGLHRLVLLDPNDQTEPDLRGERNPAGQVIQVMRRVQSVLAPTPKEAAQNCNGGCETFQPRYEWCVNMGVYDPYSNSVYANSEDSYHYRWHLPTNELVERVYMTTPQLEAYTPTSIGPDGAVYAINKGRLFVFEAAPNTVGTRTEATTEATRVATTEATTTPAVARECISHQVEVGDNFFRPQLQEVKRGDVVNWVWIGGFHNVIQVPTADECFPPAEYGGFNSGVPVSSFGNNFSINVTQSVGSPLYYMCQPHCLSGMNGRLDVTGACCGRAFGDCNYDGKVNLNDIVVIISNWGDCPTINNECVGADFNCDGRIDLQDIVVVINTWTGTR